MAEYIEREALMVALCKEIVGDGDYYNGKDDMQDEIRDMVSRFPVADVAPVRHGYWRPILHKDGKTDYECSCCLGIIMDVPDDDEHDLCAWCSMCGAKMDLEG